MSVEQSDPERKLEELQVFVSSPVVTTAETANQLSEKLEGEGKKIQKLVSHDMKTSLEVKLE